ncbi:hypothetical protein C7S20_12460 [Christiangramia fulva]|uniref:Lipoprotein n=1 Tax=Christiangramia fulva TaxID=2126553 RepID=A0A2R3Z6U5_9FLAO|nr:hypothetical protein [Christiangramia fulva]AVR46001.1 hypothetical protein C7S20_12460 [Christiangramia fulva]
MKVISAFLVALFFLSCNKEESNQISDLDLKVGEHSMLKNGKCFDIQDTPFQLCLDSIGDSRCPEAATCVWAGDAVAYLSLKSAGEKKSFALHTHPNFQQDTMINNLHFKLIDVSPFPKLNTQINARDYSVDLLIENE